MHPVVSANTPTYTQISMNTKCIFGLTKIHLGVGLLVLVLLGYGILTHTSAGRIAGVYAVGGWKAPWSVRTECRHTARGRVETLFTKPLAMSDDAKSGLREYWHYSYYRECLYRAGYSFMGNVLPESTLYVMGDTERWYMNPLAGVHLRVPVDTRIIRDNELDVTFDARLLRSELSTDGTTFRLDAYTGHQFVHTFADLPDYVEHFVTGTSTVTMRESATTTSGIPYLAIEQDADTCGILTVTPDAYILHMKTSCEKYEDVQAIAETLTFIDAVSLH